MKTIFIPAKGTLNLDKIKEIKINEKLGLVTTIQYVNYLKDINKIIKNSVIGGKILGCNVDNALKIKNKVDSYLYIGTGEFHPVEVALETGKRVYTFNPITNEFSELKNVEEFKKKQKGAYLRFLNAKKIGILVSTKPGQCNLNLALKLKKTIKKEIFIFLCDNIREEELENFPDIDYWVNTACPRITGKGIINVGEVLK